MKQKLLLASFFIVTFIFSSCYSSKTFLKKDQIPQDFGKGNVTLLVIEKDIKIVDRAIRNNIEKYYKGNYEIITASDIYSKKYEDLKKYKYTFNIYSEYTAGQWIAGKREAPSTDYHFGVTDRSTAKAYKMLRSGGFKKLSKAYIQALEIMRTKNEL